MILMRNCNNLVNRAISLVQTDSYSKLCTNPLISNMIVTQTELLRNHHKASRRTKQFTRVYNDFKCPPRKCKLICIQARKQNLCAPVWLQNSKKQKIHLHTLRKINVYMNTLDLPQVLVNSMICINLLPTVSVKCKKNPC